MMIEISCAFWWERFTTFEIRIYKWR